MRFTESHLNIAIMFRDTAQWNIQGGGMTSVQISMRGFAEVSSAAFDRKRTTLKKFKFPKAEDSVGRSNYYIKALSAIKRHHKGQTAQVRSTLRRLAEESAIEPDTRKRAKLLNNRRAITEYLDKFGDRTLEIKKGKRLYYTHNDVVVSAHPDLIAEENGRLILIKLNLCKSPFSGGVISVLLHVLFEAAKRSGLDLNPVQVECLQICDGSLISGPRNGFPSSNALDAACSELQAIW